MPEKFYHRINVKILLILFILFTVAATCVSVINMRYLRSIYETNFTQRVLLTNNVIAAMVGGDDASAVANLLRGQDEDVKASQLQFHLDREELRRLESEGASEAEKAGVLARMEDFQHNMESLKSRAYWDMIERLRQINEISNAKRSYILADTGVTDQRGNTLYTYLFDTKDSPQGAPGRNGMGVVTYAVSNLKEVYRTKTQMEQVFHSDSPGDESYYAYAPILGHDGSVIAVLGTDVYPGEMKQEIRTSILLSNLVLFSAVLLILLATAFFLRRAVTAPLGVLIGVAQKLSKGDIHAAVHPSALRQRSELGLLARIINDMGDVYRRMILNRAILDANPFTCVVFDEDYNVIDCNPRTLVLYRFDSIADLNEGYRAMLKTAIPERQPDGRVSRSLNDQLQTAFSEGYCEFDTYLNLHGQRVPFNNVMKRSVYRGKPAVILYQFDLTAQKEIQHSLEYRGKLLQAMSDISELLLASEIEDYAAALRQALAILGETAQVDRVYLWRNSADKDGNLYMTQLYEWSPSAEPQQESEWTINLPYEEVFPSWKETLLLGQCLNGFVKDLGEAEQAHLTPQGIVSLLIAPLFVQKTFWGFIGFDDCHAERVFSRMEENILRVCGHMIMVSSDIAQNEIAISLIAAKEEALATAQMKGSFLANMSHEIRTPMNAILGMTELILHEEISDTVLNHTLDIKNASRGLLSIINDILEISKIESGKLAIASVRYHVSSVLMDVVSMVKIRTDKKRLSLLVDIDPALPCELIGDEVRVKQILINLLNNAVKFTRRGMIKLTVSGRAEDGRFLLECVVADTGIGLRREDLGRLFESFQQFDTTRNRNVEGTGLGLSISKQLAEMMNGFITVESEYGVGSTFTVQIEQGIANRQPIAALKYPERNNVLIYERREIYVRSLKSAFDRLGCRYRHCESQAELASLLEASAMDYIFVAAPNVNKVLALPPETRRKAVIVSLNGNGRLSEAGLRTISMPIHSLQIANILNDEDVRPKSRDGGSEDTSNMIAPAAKVLVVDDNAVNLKVAVGLLKTFAIFPDTAASGAQAIDMVRETDYDLVFMDHMMPEMDGVEAVRRIRRKGADAARLPIIALTANAVSGMREMFLENGFSDYLAKPIEMSKLSGILSRWIPAEKRMRLAGAAETPPAPGTGALMIEGLDTARGQMMTGGSEERYREVLAVYCHDAAERMARLMEPPEEEALPLFVTNVHALKSASASIGAAALSEDAAFLEKAGLQGDLAGISMRLAPFREALAALTARIQETLAHDRAEPTAPSALPPDALDGLRKALLAEDIRGINEQLYALMHQPLEAKERSKLERIAECILMSDFQDALANIDDLLPMEGRR